MMIIDCQRWGIITEIKHVMASDLADSKIRVCPRICNSVAHELAALGYKLPSGSYTIWNDVPHIVEGLVSSKRDVTNE